MLDQTRWLRVSVVLFSVCIVSGFLGMESVSAQGTRMLRSPTVSSSHVAFVTANDIWLVGREGGEPRRLTWHPEALRLLETQGVELKPEPAAPIRYRRPGGGGG